MMRITLRLAGSLLLAVGLSACGRDLVKVRIVRPRTEPPPMAVTNTPVAAPVVVAAPPEAPAEPGTEPVAPAPVPDPVVGESNTVAAVTESVPPPPPAPPVKPQPAVVETGTETDRPSARVRHPVGKWTPMLSRLWPAERWRVAEEEGARLLSVEIGSIPDRVAAAAPAESDVPHPHLPVAYALARRGQERSEPATTARAVDLLVALARRQDNTLPLSAAFDVWETSVPVDAIAAYDLTYDSPRWMEYPAQARELVEAWFMDRSTRLLELLQQTPLLPGTSPVALCHLSVAAQVINERNLVTSFATAMARLWGPSSFHADGVWWENTHDFTRSATEQGSLALGPLQEIAARLPEEARTGAVSVDALKQVAERSRLSAQATAGLRLPDGRPLTRGDTAWQPPGTNFVGFTNLTYNDSGLFSLSRGTDPSGTALYLGLSPMAAGGRYGGGHQHDDRLSLLLWTGGRDVLSDAGYPVFLKGNNRFFHTSAWAHNMTVATDTTQKPQAGWARSGLLGYDPGSGTGQQVQAILASSPGPAMDGVTVNERCLVLVGADRQRSYTLDVTWIKGGSVHESFLRSAEDEDCESRVTPALTSARGTLAEALGEAPGYLPSHRARLSLAGTGRGGQDFDVTWTGKESGLTLHSYLRGIPYETVFLSRMPRLRPTENSVETKDNFPGWHLYRRREVRPEDITCVAAVHDTARKGERGLILNVEWLRPAPADAGAVAVKVYLRDRIDTWYFSRDTIHRTVDGNSFAGRICGAAGSGARLAWGYVWGAGELQMGPLRVTGAAPVEGEVLAIGRDATTGRSFFEVASTFVPDNTLKGRWGCLMGADGVGNGYRMVSAKAAGEGKVRVEVEGEIGWGMENGLVTRSWFPLSTGTGEGRITLAAPVTFRVDRAVFQPGSP